MTKPAIFLLSAIICCNRLYAQRIEILTHHNNLSLRGLSVVSEKIIWVSGTNGTVGRSIDAGKTWRWMTVKNFEKRDFRDIDAFDENTAVVMAVAEPANMLRTTDGGMTWKTVFADSTKGMFLDAMDFADSKHGVVIGDPIKNRVFLAHTDNQGENWKVSTHEQLLADGEALFAASGSNVQFLLNKRPASQTIFFVTGGKRSRVFENEAGYDLKIIQGKETQGANAIRINREVRKGIIVGGDFARDTVRKNNCLLFSWAGRMRFFAPLVPPHGYRSCVEYISTSRLICCGTSGVDISEDGGLRWRWLSGEGFHVCKKSKKGNAIFLAGPNGKIARLIW